MIELPDLSHLTNEEQQKIFNVIKRQQDEEEKEKKMLKVLHDQFEEYKSRVKVAAEESKTSPLSEENDPVCSLCCKTKFAEGCGHICTFCEIKFCSRCGGRITIKSNKNEKMTMWVCNICRKEQEIVLKTGSWYHGGTDLALNMKSLTENTGKSKITVDKLQIELVPNIDAEAELTSEENVIKHSVSVSMDDDTKLTLQLPDRKVENNNSMASQRSETTLKKVAPVPNFVAQPTPRSPSTSIQHLASTQSMTAFDRYKTSSTENLVNKNLSKDKTNPLRKSISHSKILKKSETNHAIETKTLHEAPGAVSASSSQLSISSSYGGGEPSRTSAPRNSGRIFQQADRRNAPGIHGRHGKDHSQGRHRIQARQPSAETLRQASARKQFNAEKILFQNAQLNGYQSEPNIAGFCKNDVRDSTSGGSRTMSRQFVHRRGYLMHNNSVSSSEDDIQSTAEYSSFDDGEKDASISDIEYADSRHMKDSQQRLYGDSFYYMDQYVDSMTKSSTSLCSCQRSTSNNRDSGVESVSVPLIDVSHHGQLPVSWQPSADGRFLIGHLLLYKNLSTTSQSARQAGALLGLKVVGGKLTDSGRLGAFITKVKKGSLADTMGHLKPGDEIISWNKACLQDATFDDVYEIILNSKEDMMVELVVSRPIKDVPRIPEARLHQTAESSSCSLDSERRDYESHNVRPLQGRIQIRIWYDDKSQQLYVTAIRAVDLPLREGGLPRNPYLKMYLLPERSNSFKRRTKTAKKTLSPEWMQTFVYGDARREDLGAMALELTLWDYDRSLEANNKFMGEVMIDLGLVCLDDEPHWFRLMPLGYGMNQDYVLETHTSCQTMPTSSLSSDTNFSREDSNNNRSAVNTRIKNDQRLPEKPSMHSKRLLPHVPTSSSQSAIVDHHSSGQSSVPKVEKQKSKPELKRQPTMAMEKETVDDSFSSKTSLDFDTSSVDQTLQEFVGGLGPGQVVGRQALALTSVGEIEIGLYERRSLLEVQVIRARKLICRPGAKILPAHYVKVYMMMGMKCTGKKKTKLALRTLNPTFDQPLVFDSSQAGNGLQVIVWGDYGRMDNKAFVGMVQISLDNLDLTKHAIGWYKLFPSSTVIDASTYGKRRGSFSSFSSSQAMG